MCSTFIFFLKLYLHHPEDFQLFWVLAGMFLIDMVCFNVFKVKILMFVKFNVL